MNQPTLIRPERADDHRAVRAVHEAAFGRPDEGRIVDAVRAGAAPIVSLVAVLDEAIAGHVLCSPVTIDGPHPARAAAGLGPIGVTPRHQGRGIGSALMRRAVIECEEQGCSALFVLGDPRYYGRFGFVLAAPRGLHYESEAFDAAFQLRELRPRALANVTGYVRYHSAFDAG